jgi:hypothetical protein
VTLVEMSGDYAARVRRQSGPTLAHEVYINRPGHCNFAPEETAAAVKLLESRRASGNWAGTVPGSVAFKPAPFLRSYPEH